MNERIERMKEILKNGGVKVHVSPLLYPTPKWLAEHMARRLDAQPHEIVLEPSAGLGALLDAVGTPPYALGIETDYKLVELLRGKGYDVLHMDFLEFVPDHRFDKIIMNPPFNGGEDIRHINHALEMLKTGGRLVALCANGPRQQKAFKHMATYWQELPSGTFEGTQVRSVMMEINK